MPRCTPHRPQLRLALMALLTLAAPSACTAGSGVTPAALDGAVTAPEDSTQTDTDFRDTRDHGFHVASRPGIADREPGDRSDPTGEPSRDGAGVGGERARSDESRVADRVNEPMDCALPTEPRETTEPSDRNTPAESIESPPTISIVHPASAVTVDGALFVLIDVAGQPSPSEVRLQLDGETLAQLTQPPWQHAWHTGPFSDGVHVLSAKSILPGGDVVYADPVEVVINHQAPTIDLLFPGPSVPLHDQLHGNALIDDVTGVDTVTAAFRGDYLATPGGGPFEWTVDLTDVPAGIWPFVVTATDLGGKSSVATIDVLVDRPPTLAPLELLGPEESGGSWEIKVSAQDDLGLSSLELLVDGAPGPPLSLVGGIQWAATWTPGSAGTFPVVARATDSSGQQVQVEAEIHLEPEPYVDAFVERQQALVTAYRLQQGGDWPDSCEAQAARALATLSGLGAAPSAYAITEAKLAISSLVGLDLSGAGELPCVEGLSSLVHVALDPAVHGQLLAAQQAVLLETLWDVAYERSDFGAVAAGDVDMLYGSAPTDLARRSAVALAVLTLAGSGSPDFPPTALLADGHTLMAHAAAWTTWFELWLRERARLGGLVTAASPRGDALALSHLCTLRMAAPETELADRAERFMHLLWADIAHDFLPGVGVRGGASSGGAPATPAANEPSLAALLHLHGWSVSLPIVPHAALPCLVSDYRVPDVVTALAVGAEPAYLARSARPGAGVALDDAFVLDRAWEGPGDRAARTSWVTPDAVLGSMAYAPTADYAEAATAGLAMGATFASAPGARLVVMGPEDRGLVGVTGSGAMVVARDPSASGAGTTRVLLSFAGDLWSQSNLAQALDKSGTWSDGQWIVSATGASFVALRVGGGMTVHPAPDGALLELAEAHSPVVVQLGDSSDYADLDAFADAVASNPMIWDGQTLTYVSESGEALSVGAGAASRDGQPAWGPAKAWDSPYMMTSTDGSTVTIGYPGYQNLVLDFD